MMCVHAKHACVCIFCYVCLMHVCVCVQNMSVCMCECVCVVCVFPRARMCCTYVGAFYVCVSCCAYACKCVCVCVFVCVFAFSVSWLLHHFVPMALLFFK